MFKNALVSFGDQFDGGTFFPEVGGGGRGGGSIFTRQEKFLLTKSVPLYPQVLVVRLLIIFLLPIIPNPNFARFQLRPCFAKEKHQDPVVQSPIKLILN